MTKGSYDTFANPQRCHIQAVEKRTSLAIFWLLYSWFRLTQADIRCTTARLFFIPLLGHIIRKTMYSTHEWSMISKYFNSEKHLPRPGAGRDVKHADCLVGGCGVDVVSAAVGRAGGNCIKIDLLGKSILRDYFQENITSRRPFLLLRIRGLIQ